MARVKIESTSSATTKGGLPNQASVFYFGLGMSAIYLIWGTTYLAIRYAVETIPPLLMMSMRHLSAGAVLYGWTRLRGTPAPKPREWFYPAMIGAVLFLGGHGSLAWAEQRVPSGIAAVLVATLPMFILLLGRVTGTETKFSRRSIAGVVLGFAGVMVLFGPDLLRHNESLNLVGAVLVLFGNFLWAGGTIWTRKVTMPGSATLSAAMQMLAGGASLGIAGGISGELRGFHFASVTAQSWLSLLYLAVFGSLVAFTAYTWLHTVEKPSRISTYAYVNPVVAVVVGWWFAQEPIGVFTVVAMVVILIGVALVNTGTKPEPRAERLAPAEEMAAD
jgi:drug/metabolite transporter (DMT)-like permease